MPTHGCTHGTVPDHHSHPPHLEIGAKQAKAGCMPVGMLLGCCKAPTERRSVWGKG